ncbi:MAG: hypothetical protein ABEJ58_09795 [Halodesulfurarchaeum sp.]
MTEAERERWLERQRTQLEDREEQDEPEMETTEREAIPTPSD